MALRIVEIFLPAAFPDGTPVPKAQFDLVRQEIVELFGGVTSYDLTPARGLWKDAGQVEADPIVVMEVMTTGSVDKRWWKAFRNRMEDAFRQKEILIRVHTASRL
jgi:hypothetical protein